MTGTVQKSLRKSLAIAKVLLSYTVNSAKGADGKRAVHSSVLGLQIAKA
jgi:hypothetical protein